MIAALPLLLSLAVHRPCFDETFAYAFASEKELADFEPRSGSWTVSAGNLWCTTRNARDELAWRRALTADGSAKVTLVGAGKVAIALRAGAKETLVRVDRAAKKVAVECDGRPLVERLFEADAAGPVVVAANWTLAKVEVRVGADEPISAARPDAGAPFEKLALVSFQSQPRFDDLSIHRDVAPSTPDATAPSPTAESGATVPLDENLRIAVERASEALEKGDADAALERLAEALPREEGKAKPKALPDAVLALLQRIGAKKPALAAKEPLKSAIERATVAARDGSAKLTLPLHSGWRAQASEVERADSPIFSVRGPSDLVVDVYRYDQKLTYWFGRDPKLVYTKGGGGPTLGKARADEQHERHAKSEFTRPFDKSKSSLGGEATFEYELTWSDPQDAAKSSAMREFFALRRGDTWRLSIAASPLALKLAAADLDWILASFRFAER